MNLTVVSSPHCKWCVEAKSLMDSRRMPYVEVEFTDALKPLFSALGLTSLPQIWDGTEHIGGYDDFVVHVANP